MFDRSRTDSPPDLTAMPVEAALADGTTMRGKLLIPTTKTLGEALNGPGPFLEFEPYGGERSYIAKAQVVSLKLMGVPKLPNLKARVRDLDGFDPHAVLGVAPGAPREDVRQAYVALAKAYHPDRYAAAELPNEVIEYLFAMARRINAAHSALTVEERQRTARAAPVFVAPGG
ncbi:MAG: J domain-containing protein [Hyphomonadaceae bacterium]|nr:J domain-containing protein [Hyphomonadaceae bacterium]